MSFTKKLKAALPLILALFPAVDGVLRLLPASRVYHRAIALPTALLCLCVVFVSRRAGSSKHAIRYTLLGAGLLGIYFVLTSYILYDKGIHGPDDNSVIGFWLTKNGEQYLREGGTRASLHSQTGPVGWEMIYSPLSQWCSLALLALFYGGSFVSLTYGFRILGASVQSSSPAPPVTELLERGSSGRLGPISNIHAASEGSLMPENDSNVGGDTATSPQPVKLFYSYAHEDEELRVKLEKHLSVMRRNKDIAGWHDRDISAGTEWKKSIDENLEAAQIIILLVSDDFLASDYCYDIEMARAMERHDSGEARVIPIILRPCDWHGAPFGKLQALPKNAEPITKWENVDEAFLNVAQGIRKVVKELAVNY